jgi:hypothetical protein
MVVGGPMKFLHQRVPGAGTSQEYITDLASHVEHRPPRDRPCGPLNGCTSARRRRGFGRPQRQYLRSAALAGKRRSRALRSRIAQSLSPATRVGIDERIGDPAQVRGCAASARKERAQVLSAGRVRGLVRPSCQPRALRVLARRRRGSSVASGRGYSRFHDGIRARRKIGSRRSSPRMTAAAVNESDDDRDAPDLQQPDDRRV